MNHNVNQSRFVINNVDPGKSYCRLLLNLVNQNKIYDLVPKEYFDHNYKIKDDVLNLRTNKLFNFSEEVIYL